MLAAKNTIVLIFVLLSVQYAYSQGVNIKILDKSGETPVSNVKVILLEPDSGHWVSNNEGIVKLTKRVYPDDTLLFRHIGYKPLKLAYSQVIHMNYIVLMELDWDDLPAVVFSPLNRQTGHQETSAEIIHIATKDIHLQNPQTSADLLAIGGKVYVQKSQLGGGSPMIRGMSANRVLIVVDGIRMNNAIFRSGNLQNVLSIDPNLVTGAEIFLGPGSVIYGTDAIGGVMSFMLKEPQFLPDDDIEYHGNAMTRLSSANRESTWHVDFEIRKQRLSFLSSVTMSNFGNLRMGSYGPDDYLREEYVQTINGRDSIVENPNPQIQYFTGYTQINLMQKARWKVSDNLDVSFAANYGTTSPIPRYDRLIQREDGQLRYSDWYYGPQNWLMTYVKLNGHRKTFFSDRARLTLAYQNFKESRITREFNSTDITERQETVKMFTANADLDKKIGSRTYLYYGAEFIRNDVGSNGFNQNIFTGEKTAASTRYPDGAVWSSTSAYARVNQELADHWNIEIGARYGIIDYSADFTNRFYSFPFDRISQSVPGQSGSAGLVYHNKSTIRLSASTGFRAPNIDDIGKVFDSEPGKVIVPNPDLGPENIYSLDLSWERKWSHKLLVRLNLFYSELHDAITRDNFTLNGSDSMIYEGELRQIQALVNTESAIIYGGQFYFDYKFTSRFKVNSNINYTAGETDQGQALRHVTPLFGASHLVYTSERFTYDLYALYNGEISYKNLAPEEQAKTHIYARDTDGNPYSPAWWTLNFKTSFRYSDRLTFLGGIENILDKRYRPYSSGITAPGLNVYASVRARF